MNDEVKAEVKNLLNGLGEAYLSCGTALEESKERADNWARQVEAGTLTPKFLVHLLQSERNTVAQILLTAEIKTKATIQSALDLIEGLIKKLSKLY